MVHFQGCHELFVHPIMIIIFNYLVVRIGNIENRVGLIIRDSESILWNNLCSLVLNIPYRVKLTTLNLHDMVQILYGFGLYTLSR